jgi:hypothetical protein
VKRYSQNLYGFGEIINEDENGKWVKYEEAETEIMLEVISAEEKYAQLFEKVEHILTQRQVDSKYWDKCRVELEIMGFVGSILMFFGGLALGHFFL